MPSAGRLRSTGIAPLQRYYAPLRLPIRSAGPLCVPGLRSGYDPDRAGLSGFHALVRGVPSVATPGSRSAAHRLFTDRVGFTLSGGLTAPIFAYRGHSVRLRYGPPLRLPRLRPGIAAVTARAATCVVERSHGQLLSSVESTWPCLTHRRTRREDAEARRKRREQRQKKRGGLRGLGRPGTRSPGGTIRSVSCSSSAPLRLPSASSAFLRFFFLLLQRFGCGVTRR